MLSDESFPMVVSEREQVISPWFTLIQREVKFVKDGETEVYHSVGQSPYVHILARNEEGLIPIVRQFRPAVAQYTWEFPSGSVDDGETAEVAAIRELWEEAGMRAGNVRSLGMYSPDTGRLTVDSYVYYIEGSTDKENFKPEPGIEFRYVTHSALRQMMLSNEFTCQLHMGVYAAALLHGIDLG